MQKYGSPWVHLEIIRNGGRLNFLWTVLIRQIFGRETHNSFKCYAVFLTSWETINKKFMIVTQFHLPSYQSDRHFWRNNPSFFNCVKNRGSEIVIPPSKKKNHKFDNVLKKIFWIGKMRHHHPDSLLRAISLLNRSPALRCLNPKVSTIFAHCVPFPLPGPPESTWKKLFISLKAIKFSAFQQFCKLYLQESIYLCNLHMRFFSGKKMC